MGQTVRHPVWGVAVVEGVGRQDHGWAYDLSLSPAHGQVQIAIRWRAPESLLAPPNEAAPRATMTLLPPEA